MPKLVSYVGHRARELLVHAQRLGQPGARPRVAVFPGQWASGSASDLRGFAVGRALRRLGWRVTLVPPQLERRQRDRVVRVERPDVVLLQQSRHPLNWPSLFPGTPCVYDVDDADVLDPRSTQTVVECCQGCAAVIVGSRHLGDLLRPYNPDVNVVWTGTYRRPRPSAPPNDRRAPVLTWANANPFYYPLEADLVRRVVLRLAGLTPFTFQLYGVNDRRKADDYLEPIRDAGVRVETFPLMAYGRFVRSLERAAVGLHPVCLANVPSQGKSFGKVLAYLAAGVAVVTSDVLDHPLFFRHGDNGLLVPEGGPDEVEHWTEACLRLLTDPRARGVMVARAETDFLNRLTTDRAATLVDRVLRRVVHGPRAARGRPASVNLT